MDNLELKIKKGQKIYSDDLPKDLQILYSVVTCNAAEYAYKYQKLEDENAELKRKLESLQPKPPCVNCDEPQVVDGKCECCEWLQEGNRYDSK